LQLCAFWWLTSFLGPIFGSAIETLVSDRGACAASNEKLDSITVAVDRGPVHCRAAEDTFRVNHRAVVQQILNCLCVTVASSRVHRIRDDVSTDVSRIDGPMIARRIRSAASAMSGEIGARRNDRLNFFKLPEAAATINVKPLAPRASNNSATLALPIVAAQSSGVAPQEVVASMSAPASSKS
jgi:hypothetical protein